jgi:LytS/YehU family sensor histidine kinase
MFQVEDFSLYIMFCILAPLMGAFTLLFLFIFEKRIDLLKNETNKLALEKELQEAVYIQLHQQIQPHFFFNTLNSILSLARLNRVNQLVRAIEVFSMFMKMKYKTDHSLISIEDELKYSNYYLEIQKLRFGSRLSYSIHVEREIERADILPFLIQTLVENAFKHSFEKFPGNAYLDIHVTSINSFIVLEVWNSSTEERTSEYPINGHGLENIERRLHLLYRKENASLHLHHKKEGTTAIVKWPLNISSK